MEDSLTLTALRMALSRRVVETGLVHHSDRGSQYASNDYTDLLKANGITVSMSRKGNPWDNAACESFMKTLKYEEVLRNEYRDLAEARASIREFLEKVYNHKRLHSALGYLPQAEFEANAKGCRCAATFCMSFLRHPEIFPSDGSASLAVSAPAHRLAESPAGSSAACSPAGPASASPTVYEYALMSSCRSSAFPRTVNCALTVCVSQGGKRTSSPSGKTISVQD
jgi:hypothetical protein